MAKVHGRAFITVGGVRYNTKEGATLKTGGVMREPVVGDGGVAGAQEKIEAPQIDCTIIATQDVSIEAIQAISDANISFDSDNGKSYVMTNSFNGPVPELSRDGIKCSFFGVEVKEV